MSVIRTLAAGAAAVAVADCAAAAGAAGAAEATGSAEALGRAFPAVGAAGVVHATARLAVSSALQRLLAPGIRFVLTLLAADRLRCPLAPEHGGRGPVDRQRLLVQDHAILV